MMYKNIEYYDSNSIFRYFIHQFIMEMKYISVKKKNVVERKKTLICAYMMESLENLE